jgi:predicted HAD superfamily Cof-like phosphohydrolase
VEKKVTPNRRFDGQKLSGEKLAQAQSKIDAATVNDHLLESAQATEDTLAWLQATWVERGFTREQMVFSIALATINLRETFPDGKDAFDAVAYEARLYYDQNKDR